MLYTGTGNADSMSCRTRQKDGRTQNYQIFVLLRFLTSLCETITMIIWTEVCIFQMAPGMQAFYYD